MSTTIISTSCDPSEEPTDFLAPLKNLFTDSWNDTFTKVPDEQPSQPSWHPNTAAILRAHIKEIQAKIQESIRQMKEREAKYRELAEAETVQDAKSSTATPRRSHGRSTGTGKASAKKNSGTSGGGDGDGDGDGPKRKKKKARTSHKVNNSPSKYLPSSKPGAHPVSPSQLPSVPVFNRGRVIPLVGLIAVLLAVIVLALLGERELAHSILESNWIGPVLIYMTKMTK